MVAVMKSSGGKRALPVQFVYLSLVMYALLSALVIGTIVVGMSLPRGEQLAYISSRDSNGEIYLMDVGRALEHNLTQTSDHEISFAWSPDGQHLALLSNVLGAANTDMYLLDVERHRIRSLANFSANPLTLAWSPDSRHVAFESDHDGNYEIYVADDADCPNGCAGNIHRLTRNSFRDYAPTWSPEGGQLLFVSYLNTRSEIHSINADGRGEHNLSYITTPDAAPLWSPDGEKILITSWDEVSYEIYLMDAGCIPVNEPADSRIPRNCENSLRDLSNHLADDWLPAWSPDSRQIVFLSRRDNDTEIYRLDIQEGQVRRLTDHPGEDRDPAWSPDGQQIAFVSNRDGGYQIYLMDTNGGHIRRLTDKGANVVPAWRP